MLCVECGRRHVGPDRCPHCGAAGSLPMFAHGPLALDPLPGPGELRSEVERIARVWSEARAERMEQVARVRALLVGKVVEVPFGPSSPWAVSPALQLSSPLRWQRRIVLAVHQASQEVRERKQDGTDRVVALRVTMPAARALVVGIHPSRPLVWAPIPWLRIPE